jgi:hypothetical protein
VPRIARVNDVALTEVHGAWEVAGVTTAPGSLIRRLVPRALRPSPRAPGLPWTDLVRLSEPPLGGPPTLAAPLARFPAVTIVRLLASVYVQEAASILAALAEPQAAAVLLEMSTHSRAAVLLALGPVRATAIMRHVEERQCDTVIAGLPPSIANPLRVSLRRSESQSNLMCARVLKPGRAGRDGKGA